MVLNLLIVYHSRYLYLESNAVFFVYDEILVDLLQIVNQS